MVSLSLLKNLSTLIFRQLDGQLTILRRSWLRDCIQQLSSRLSISLFPFSISIFHFHSPSIVQHQSCTSTLQKDPQASPGILPTYQSCSHTRWGYYEYARSPLPDRSHADLLVAVLYGTVRYGIRYGGSTWVLKFPCVTRYRIDTSLTPHNTDRRSGESNPCSGWLIVDGSLDNPSSGFSWGTDLHAWIKSHLPSVIRHWSDTPNPPLSHIPSLPYSYVGIIPIMLFLGHLCFYTESYWSQKNSDSRPGLYLVSRRGSDKDGWRNRRGQSLVVLTEVTGTNRPRGTRRSQNRLAGWNGSAPPGLVG